MGAPLPNPDVPLNAAPGSYFYISQQGQQPPAPSGVVNGAGRMNILAYRKGGSAPANTPTQVFGLDDCDGFFGAKSDVRRIVARILSSGRTGLNLIVTGVEEPSAGTARTFPLAFSGTP